MAKYMLDMATLAANMHRHVFNNAQNWHADFFKHLDALARIQQRNVLWRGDNHRPRQRHALAKRELNVTRAGRHVDDQIVEVAPIGLPEQLVKRLGRHRPTPDHGLVRLHQKAYRHHLNTVVFKRLHVLAVQAFRLARHAHHHRHAGAVNIGVEQANACALNSQSQSQIDSGGAFAHPALAGCHSNDVFDVRQQLYAALHRMTGDLGGDVHCEVADAFHADGRLTQQLDEMVMFGFARVGQFKVN